MAYNVQLTPAAARELDALPRQMYDRVLDKIETLAEDPRPHGVEKLRTEEAYRVRVGDYRICYEIHDQDLVVVVIRVGDRRDVYRQRLGR